MAKAKQIWFKKVRGSYLPCSWQGWLLYIPFAAFLISVILIGFGNRYTVWEFLYAIFPYFVCAGVVMHWVASRFSKE